MARNGEIVDDIIRHGPHYIFWCYEFERRVSHYCQTKTNRKPMEMTLIDHLTRIFCTTVQDQLWMDEDGQYPLHKTTLDFHKCLFIPRCIRDLRSENGSCSNWHQKSIVIARSQEIALSFAEGIRILRVHVFLLYFRKG